MHERALAIRKQALGQDDPLVAITLNHIGNAWLMQKSPARARKMYENALVILERQANLDYQEIATTLLSLGQAWYALGAPEHARDQYVRALNLVHSRFPEGLGLESSLRRNLRSAAPDLIVLDDGRIID
jgi:tetratricopeptide (TPR) repeat protein